MNNRRKLVVALGVGPLAWAGAIFSQSKTAPVVIGWLSPGSRATQRRLFAAFKEGVAELGWKEGVNYVLEERWADGRNGAKSMTAPGRRCRNRLKRMAAFWH